MMIRYSSLIVPISLSDIRSGKTYAVVCNGNFRLVREAENEGTKVVTDFVALMKASLLSQGGL